MHYDPYEPIDSKKRRYISNIAIAFVILAMVAAIFALVFHDKSEIKYDFEKISTENLSLSKINGDNHELFDICSKLSTGNGLYVNESFADKFPITYSLLNLDSKAYTSSSAVYGKNEVLTSRPFIEAGGGYISIAMCVASKEKDCRDLIVSVYAVSADCKNCIVTFSIIDSTDYCIRYNTRNPNAPLRLLSGKQSASLDVFRLTVQLTGKSIKQCGYSYILDRSFSEDRIKSNLYHQLIYDPINKSYCNPSIKSGDDSTVISAQQSSDQLKANTDNVAYAVNYSDKIKPMIKQISTYFEYGTPTEPEFVLIFN